MLVDWLIVQQTCEWCGGTIDYHDYKGQRRLAPAEWRCWKVGHTKHWKAWRICSSCRAKERAGSGGSLGDFSRWIFPVIALMPEHESLSALMEVQPMNPPNAQVFYMDFLEEPGHHEGGTLDEAPVV